MGVEVRPRARRAPEPDEQRGHVAPALQRDAQRFDAVSTCIRFLSGLSDSPLGMPGYLSTCHQVYILIMFWRERESTCQFCHSTLRAYG